MTAIMILCVSYRFLLHYKKTKCNSVKVLNAKRTSAVVDETFTGAALAKIQATAFKIL